MLFAKQNINQLNLKVRAGRALPDRFQGFLQKRDLLAELGSDLIVDVDSRTEGYVLVDANKLAALEAELARLKKRTAPKEE